MTRAQLLRFIKLRNTAEFQNNLQFQIDANAAGFTVTDLGEVTKVGEGHYSWQTRFGTLVEKYGRLTLERRAESA